VPFNRFALTDFLRLLAVTRSELAVQAEISPSYVTELLDGTKKAPSLKTVRKIATALDIDHRALMYLPPASGDVDEEAEAVA
jgi:transcriptional regulator with XRE-family HTH domain